MLKSSEARKIVETNLGQHKISLETGWVAKQAHGCVIVRQGDTEVMVTVCHADPRPDIDFFPLTVEYTERAYAGGKIPGGFFKREGRPGEFEILACRVIDRPIRPMFPDGFKNEVQIIATVLSSDGEHNPDVLAICGASAALHVSEIPFLEPIAGVRVGRINGEFILNPSEAQIEQSDIELVVAGTKESIVMVEGGASMAPEKDILDTLDFAHGEIKNLIELQNKLREQAGKEKIEFVPEEINPELVSKVAAELGGKIEEALSITEKKVRNKTLSEIKEGVIAALEEQFPEELKTAKELISKKIKEVARNNIITTKKRIDNRDLDQVRPIECETGLIPRTHGSSLFTRGETQGLVVVTLGTGADAQRIDRLTSDEDNNFMLHYNFPPFCTGEAKMLRGTSRREVGHGNLARRAVAAILPSQDDFPYVVRIVSEITESNGSSSMATVCGSSLSLMDAGVKIKAPVAGVAMGLIKQGEDVAVLTDILGDEDHFGDMDFKVCGTEEGITAMQMDIKCTGLSRETMEKALSQAREARLHILGEMAKALPEAREEMSPYAPRITSIKIDPDKIRLVIGSGGKTINGIVEETGVKIDIEDDGTIKIASSDGEASKRAIEIIEGIIEEAEIGKIYCGIVKSIKDFGAFVEILPGTEGLLHISQIAPERVNKVEDYLNEGDEVKVKVLDVDKQGKIRLSRKEALAEAEGAVQ